MDFTNTFRDLSRDWVTTGADTTGVEFKAWRTRWQERLRRQPQDLYEAQTLMRRNNPAFIPRNHKVEEALAAATAHGDLSLVEKLGDVLAHPFAYDRQLPEFGDPPSPSNCAYQTFCGT